LCNRSPERIRLDVVREPPAAVDLDHRQPLPIRRLERGSAADVYLAELEAELVAELPHLHERALAQMATLGVVDDDVRVTDRCPA
jgi:hypothetical protein